MKEGRAYPDGRSHPLDSALNFRLRGGRPSAIRAGTRTPSALVQTPAGEELFMAVIPASPRRSVPEELGGQGGRQPMGLALPQDSIPA